MFSFRYSLSYFLLLAELLFPVSSVFVFFLPDHEVQEFRVSDEEREIHGKGIQRPREEIMPRL